MPDSIPIVCPYCGVGCNLDLALDDSGRPVKSSATGRNPELNARYACVKGFTVHELLNHPERLTQPYIRKADKLELVSWKTAIARRDPSWSTCTACAGIDPGASPPTSAW